MGFYLEPDDIRAIIKNAHLIKRDCKCEDCRGTGTQNWDEDGMDLKPGPPSPNDPDRDWGPCESCEGIGYTNVLDYLT